MTRDVMAASRPTVHRRSGGMCERCGAARAAEVHHRKLRRHGDHDPANLVDLCKVCHVWVHANVAKARAAGFIVFSTLNPRTIPVTHAWLGRVTLDDAGGWELAA